MAKATYDLTKDFPKEELYGLTSQMRRCAASIPSNITEDASRDGGKEFLRFLYIASGSANELDTQLEICKEISKVTDDRLHLV